MTHTNDINGGALPFAYDNNARKQKLNKIFSIVVARKKKSFQKTFSGAKMAIFSELFCFLFRVKILALGWLKEKLIWRGND